MAVWRLAGVALGVSMLACGLSQAAGYRGGSDRGGGASARIASAPAGFPVAVYAGKVRVTGQLIVSFHGDPAGGCALTHQCDVKSGTLTWTPPSTGSLEVEDLGARSHPRFQAVLDLSSINGQLAASAAVQRSYADGTRTCIDTAGFGDDARLPVSSDVAGELTFGLYAAHPTFRLLAAPQTPLDLAYGFLLSAPGSDEPAPTHCGGPLPSDFLPSI